MTNSDELIGRVGGNGRPRATPAATALRSLGGLALAAADRYSGDAMRAPGRPAITYAEFGRAIREIAGGLASLGVGPATRSAILVRDRPRVDAGRLRRVLRRRDGRARLPHELARGVRVRALALGREGRSCSRTPRRPRRSPRCASSCPSSST